MKFTNVVFDLDSTLSTIEGIDQLGELKKMRPQIERLTNQAMSGKILLEKIFLKRLTLLQPTKSELEIIGQLYQQNVTPGTRRLLHHLRVHSANIFVVTGGYVECIYPLTDYLAIPRENVFANHLLFTESGKFRELDRSIPLWRNLGKQQIVTQIRKNNPGPTAVIGDGISDYEAGLIADRFIYFGGVTWREEVASLAQYCVHERNLMALWPYLD